MFLRLNRLVLTVLAFAIPLAGRAALLKTSADAAHVKASLLAGTASPQPGQSFQVALRLEHESGWHTYWIFAGTGYATTLKWDLPTGWTAGPIQWPTPEKILDVNKVVTGIGYTDIVDLPVTITPSADYVAGQPVTLTVKADWLMCWSQQCVPGGATVQLSLPAAAPDPAVAAAVASLPRDLPGWKAEAERAGKKLTLRLTAPAGATPPAASTLWFFGDRDFVAYGEPQTAREEKPGVFAIDLAVSATADATVQRLTGVVRTEGSWTAGEPALPGWKIDVPVVDVAGADAAPGSLAGTLALAFLGGLILNLMPCVFPVLGLKILGFVHQAGADRKKVALHGVVFTVGVLLSFWALAGALAVLRAGGAHLGWGFQLQTPAFVFVLAGVMLVFALNLSGVFEFGLRATSVGGSLLAKQGYAGSFFTGVLATVAATPCSAPLLAPALGTALTLPTLPSFAVFTAIGLGLSLPYLAFSAFPAAAKSLPRPGAWMETFKQFLAFPLYATAGWLVWVMVPQVSEEAHLNVFLGLTLIAMAAWCYGRFAAPGSKPGRARFGVAAGAGLLAVGLWLGWPVVDRLTWEAWSPERVAQLRADNRTIYVDFTARWCATCQTNKKVVFSSSQVNQALAGKNVALLKADWTNRDGVIADELAKWGRSAVPFDLIYLPGKADPVLLPEVLTSGIVLDALATGDKKG